MNAVTEQALDQRNIGLYDKFRIERTDGSSAPGERHHGDDFFVLNLTTDRHAIPAIKAYAKSCEVDYPQLAADLRAKLRAKLPSEFVTVPETTLPNGTVVPAFQVSRFLCTVEDGAATVQADGVPTVEISYHDAIKACDAANMTMIRETQALALAWNVYNVGANWTSGKVGEGNLRQGLRKGNVDGAQANDFEPEDPDEDRRFWLPTGEPFYDVAGHLFTWVFDDVQGDERGIVAKKFTEESVSIAISPFPSRERGTGWRPSLPCDWSGDALVRGGYWWGEDNAGVFGLGGARPDDRSGIVGFRSTKSLG